MTNIITPGLALKAAVPGDDRRGGALTTNNTVSETNKFGVDAVELNPNIEGSMAHGIAEVNSNLANIDVYVGEEDGLIHFVDSAGADTALNFSSEVYVLKDSTDKGLDLSGGWTCDDAWTFEDNRLSKVSTGNWSGAITNNMIDLTEYGTIVMYFKNIEITYAPTQKILLDVNKNKNTSGSEYTKIVSFAMNEGGCYLGMDVSDLIGEYYINVRAIFGEGYIDSIYLTKD